MPTEPKKIADALLKKIRMAQIVTNVIRVLVFFYAAYEIWQGPGPAITLIWFVLFLVASHFVLGVVAQMMIQKIDVMISDKCIPVTYLEVYDILKESKEFRNRKTTTATNMANAYYWSGDFQKSYETLQGMNFQSKAPIQQIPYYFSLGRTAAKLEDMEIVENALHQLRLINNRVKKNGRMAKSIAACTSALRFLLDEYDGIAERTVATCQRDVDRAKSNLEEVTSTFRLAEAYIAAGDYDQAEEALFVVIEKGGQLFCVEKAKALLREV